MFHIRCTYIYHIHVRHPHTIFTRQARCLQVAELLGREGVKGAPDPTRVDIHTYIPLKHGALPALMHLNLSDCTDLTARLLEWTGRLLLAVSEEYLEATMDAYDLGALHCSISSCLHTSLPVRYRYMYTLRILQTGHAFRLCT